ncbi:hypothetical protein DKM44_07165 [Deinococcus irradiatisoli]|uniref:Uncharacterized protein n=1 Tax=Deinococcus irradiatisoli TaxID=2202254 RepID=A0A2Z3JGC2_9DEIO|nr:hypothetical protein [Deinococcus irradiatisoli]AWN23036.1 hypothetical protein DKM44_07165 [Deinococcus irradiatisoli]
MTADELNRNWAAQLSPTHQQVWKRMQEQGAQASWTDDAAPRFVVTQHGRVLATHLKGNLPAGVVVPAALFEAGHKIETQGPDIKILPEMASA